jgi:hypothetical protein
MLPGVVLLCVDAHSQLGDWNEACSGEMMTFLPSAEPRGDAFACAVTH